MNSALKIVLVLANIFGVLCQSEGTEGVIDQVEQTAQNLGQQTGLSDDGPADPIEFNKLILKPITEHFGNVGPVVYDALTSENALGNEISQSSSVIREQLGAPLYSENLQKILETADGVDFSQRLSPLFKKVEDLKDQDGNTLKDALDIIKNVFQDPNAVSELRSRITAPSSAVPAA